MGIALVGFQTFLREELGIGINLSTMLIKLAFFTKMEIKILAETIGYNRLVKGRTIPANYKELMQKYKQHEITKDQFIETWMKEKKRISITI
ncbi:MAG: hypothetical protein ACTSP3_00240, partial [Candidatus Heimdallarchaeaceae archaeon]